MSGNLRSSSSTVLYALCLRSRRAEQGSEFLFSFCLSDTYTLTQIINTHSERYVSGVRGVILNASPCVTLALGAIWLHDRSIHVTQPTASATLVAETNQIKINICLMGPFVSYSPSQHPEGKLNSKPIYLSHSLI